MASSSQPHKSRRWPGAAPGCHRAAPPSATSVNTEISPSDWSSYSSSSSLTCIPLYSVYRFAPTCLVVNVFQHKLFQPATHRELTSLCFTKIDDSEKIVILFNNKSASSYCSCIHMYSLYSFVVYTAGHTSSYVTRGSLLVTSRAT